MESILKAKRLEKNMTLEEVGRLVGVGKSTVRKWENGMIENMGRDKIVALSKALNISPLEILGMDEELSGENHEILSIYNKLEPPRQEKVYTYAEEQLHEQESEKVVSIDKKNFAFETIAAHATEDGKMASEEEIISYAQKIIDAHKKKMEKNN